MSRNNPRQQPVPPPGGKALRSYDVAAYIYPAYHYEPRLQRFWPEKDGEWYIVRRGKPRFAGHDMPRIPLLGYQDEADPAVMRLHVELARAHGINVFIVDWYWYENAPCFERQLNDGLIPALAGTDTKFYLMWANHDVDTLWDMNVDTHWDRPRPVLWSGRVSREVLEPMFERIIDRYLRLDCYYRIGGKPVFSIFEPATLAKGLGGTAAARQPLDWMRDRARAAGLPGLELQAIARPSDLTAEGTGRALGFDSATAYQFSMDAGGSGDYVPWADKAIARWPGYEQAFGVYYPHVSVGWDNTQRNPSFGAESVVTGSTPEAFEACLWKARRYLDERPAQTPLVTLNSWNEWTEGSYLLPDMRWGCAFLRAVRNVFAAGGGL